MDPASFAFSVAALSEVAARVVEYLHDIKEGGKQRIRLTAEVSALWIILENVNAQVVELAKSPDQTSTSGLRALATPSGPLEQCQDILVKLEAKVLPRRGKGGVLQTLKWTFDKEEVKHYLDAIHRLQMSINLAYSQAVLSTLNSIGTDVAATRSQLDDREARDILDWLSPLDFEAQQRQVFSDWCPGTLAWFLEHEQVQNWRAGTNPYVWIPGAPGSGKTVLSSFIVNALRTSEPSMKQVLGIYLSLQPSVSTRSVEDVVGSLLKQSIRVSGIHQSLRDAYRAREHDGGRLSLDELVCYLNRSLSPANRHFLVLDGMDELRSQQDRLQLLEKLKSLDVKLSIMLISRPDATFRKLLAPLSNICDICDAEHEPVYYHCELHVHGGWDVCEACYKKGNSHCPVADHAPLVRLESSMRVAFKPRNDDIRQYVQSRLERHELYPRLIRGGDRSKQDMIDSIIGQDSRFLIAKLHMNQLDTLHTVKEMKHALSQPLATLEQTYDRALTQLQSLPSARQQLACQALRWVAYSIRALNAEELEQAVLLSIDGQDADLDDAVPASKIIEDYCYGILSFNIYEHVEFVHLTATEYFSSLIEHWFPNHESEMICTCLKFLMRPEFAADWSARSTHLNVWEQYPFYYHAVKCWATRIYAFSFGAASAIAIDLLRSDRHLATALGAISSFKYPWYQDIAEGMTGLHLTSLLKLPSVIETLLNGYSVPLDAQDGKGRTALYICSARDLVSGVELLLDAGADPNIGDDRQMTPLLRAIRDWSFDVLELLLFHTQNAADVNLKHTSQRGKSFELSPLLYSALTNSPCIPTLLRRSDIVVDMEFGGMTALWSCSFSGFVEPLKALARDIRCDVDAVGSGGGYAALHIAAKNGHVAAMKVLLAAGAMIDRVGHMGRTPLLLSVLSGNRAPVQVLLDQGASRDSRDAEGHSIVHCAMFVPDILMLKQVLEVSTGSDLLNAQDNEGDTPLHLSLFRGLEEHTELMIERGAKVDIGNNDGLTALQIMRRKKLDLRTQAARGPETEDTVCLTLTNPESVSFESVDHL